MTTTQDNNQSKGEVHWLDVEATFEQMETLLDLLLDQDHDFIDHQSQACISCLSSITFSTKPKTWSRHWNGGMTGRRRPDPGLP